MYCLAVLWILSSWIAFSVTAEDVDATERFGVEDWIFELVTSITLTVYDGGCPQLGAFRLGMASSPSPSSMR